MTESNLAQAGDAFGLPQLICDLVVQHHGLLEPLPGIGVPVLIESNLAQTSTATAKCILLLFPFVNHS